MDRASVHMVIVNWNSGAQLRECLQSFLAVAKDDIALLRVTAADNASTDGSAETLDAALRLVVIRNSANRGFAAASNQGAAGAEAGFRLCLSPDTRLMPGRLELPARHANSGHDDED